MDLCAGQAVQVVVLEYFLAQLLLVPAVQQVAGEEAGGVPGLSQRF